MLSLFLLCTQSQYSSQERLHYAAPPLTPEGNVCISSSPSTVIALSHSLPKPKRHRHHHQQQQFDSNDSNNPPAAVEGDAIGSDGHVSSGSNSSGLRSPLLRPRSQSLRSNDCYLSVKQIDLWSKVMQCCAERP